MARAPLNELEITQNPALGAFLLWRFGLSYQDTKAEAPCLLEYFFVLPLVLHSPTLDIISSTYASSGLSLFASKLGEDRENLLSVHERVLALRDLTLRAISAGLQAGLFKLNYESAALHAITLEKKPPKLPVRLTSFPKGAEKIGIWLAKTPLDRSSSLLEVQF